MLINIFLQTFGGSQSVLFRRTQLEALGWEPDSYYLSLIIEVVVTERFTDIKANSTSYVRVFPSKVKMELLHAPKTAKPGLIYTVYVGFTLLIIINYFLLLIFLLLICTNKNIHR